MCNLVQDNRGAGVVVFARWFRFLKGHLQQHFDIRGEMWLWRTCWHTTALDVVTWK